MRVKLYDRYNGMETVSYRYSHLNRDKGEKVSDHRVLYTASFVNRSRSGFCPSGKPGLAYITKMEGTKTSTIS